MKKILFSLFLAGCLIAITSCGEEEPVIVPVPAPSADFSFTIDGKTVAFTDESTEAATYSWDFGDGNSSTSASPSHTYDGNGSYVVKLTVANATGDDDKQSVMEIINVNIDGDFSDWADIACSVEPSSGTISCIKLENLENNKLFVYVEGSSELTPLTQVLLNVDNDKTTGAFIDWLYLNAGEDLLIEGSLPLSDEQFGSVFPCSPCDGSNPGNWNWGDPVNEDITSFLEASELLSEGAGFAYEFSIDLTALGQTIADDGIGIAVLDVSLDTWGPVGAAPDFFEENENPEGTLFSYEFK